MNTTPIARAFAGFAAAGLALFGAAVPASAADGTPTTPTDLYNEFQACSTDQTKPLYLSGRSGLKVMGIPGHTDPDVTRATVQFRAWPVSDPTQVITAKRTNASLGWEASATLGGYNAPLLDGETYAWQAQTVDANSGAASDWSASCYVAVDNTSPSTGPTVSSPNYPEGQQNQGGTPIELTFGANGVGDVAGYTFTWNDSFPVPGATIGERGIPVWHDPYETSPDYFVRADSVGGSATVHLIPPYNTGRLSLRVASRDRAGNRSETATYVIAIKRDSPTVTMVAESPRYGGQAVLKLTPDPALHAISPVVSYTVEGLGPDQSETTVQASEEGIANVKITLDDPYGKALRVRSTSANGWVSQWQIWHSNIDTSPNVTSVVYPENGSGGGAGVPGTFTITPKIKGATSYTYSFDWGESTTVKAPAGRAEVSWTPAESGWHYLEVYGTTENGLQTASTYYSFFVN